MLNLDINNSNSMMPDNEDEQAFPPDLSEYMNRLELEVFELNTQIHNGNDPEPKVSG